MRRLCWLPAVEALGGHTLQRSVLGDAMDRSIGQLPIETRSLCCHNLTSM